LENKKKTFPGLYVPFATHFFEDLDITCKLFEALHAGVQALPDREFPAADRPVWANAAKYLQLRDVSRV